LVARAAVLGVEALVMAAGRGRGKGTILAVARGGMSLESGTSLERSASSRSTDVVFIFSDSMGAV
jgi:hypothetical protein